MRKALRGTLCAFVLACMLCGCSTIALLAEEQLGESAKQETALAQEKSAPASAAEAQTTPIPVPDQATPVATASPAPTATPEPTPETAYYVLPESGIRRIDVSELYGLSAWECCVARNEIYARHGRIFRDAELAAYFDSMPWYTPQVDPDTFDANASERLSKIELDNVQTILQYELDTFGD